ncbi:DsbA family oxidoreductase [Halostella sp. JP-L12]|uniref:DsbA family oxidoreductase n=1 Tax=Halostella TaxID=1843185 RepID=UPI000EF7717F|nr:MULTISPECIES: DsbA family oxidoreductase [Halostella]NHN47895.1 DsbA family oxidoreductase [Halostella sp. JP-L12]
MSQQQEDAAITVFADYVCPFCYLGRESLRQYQDSRDEELEVDWHPFDLRAQKRDENGEIDHDVDDGKDDDYYSQARENVKRLQEQYDVEMVQELVTDVDSLDAQVVSYFVKEHYPYETWAEFDESVYDALWKDGRDIGDADVLVELADEAGVDPDEVRSALDDDTLRSEVEEQFQVAHQQGITGVPTFAYDGHAARGAVPPEQLERLVEGA